VAVGPFEGFFHSIAGDPWTNRLFMLGLLGIGVP
jgi:thiosulfate dehydrogenase [quinone] large subunit